ncbi:beta-ketoacyl synthase, partial [Candidatus Scalindua japonica]
MSGRMPGSSNLEEFWKNLEGGKDLISEIPADRWDWRAYYGDPQKEVNKTNIKWGGFIDDVDKFDPMFFGISPMEAELMDPQQRLFMECVWETIEDAGYKPSDLSGTKTGLYVGVASSDYASIIHEQEGREIEAHMSTGLAHSVLANRISYMLNLHGPSEPIDTACSSSLVSIHRAVQSMQTGDCDLAIAGGVNALLSPELFISFGKAGMLAPDGRCKTFSKGANGYVRGEGVGAILLKPLDKAITDGDHIYGVIRGTSENHGGKANSLTAPSPRAQAELLITAYERAGIDPETVGYIEAHGTGTELGDPIEINGLKAAFKESHSGNGKSDLKEAYCGLGSVKTNIGHLETAAGIAGVLKVLLSLQHKKLPASLHSEELNPYIDLSGSPFYVVKKTCEWKGIRDEHDKVLPRRAGISSFGFGGANSHIIVEEYIAGSSSVSKVNKAGTRSPVLVVLSARSGERLKESAERLLGFVKEKTGSMCLADIAYTLQVGREAMDSRAAFLVKDNKDLINQLEAFAAGKEGIEDCYTGEVKRNKDVLSVFAVDDDLQEAIDKWIAKGKLSKLAELWVKGLVLDWDLLYGEHKPCRISLPTYPFARERCWVPDGGNQRSVISNQISEVIHPLLHRNTSDLTEQQFTTRLTGKEFFLSDHRINDEKVLPGVVYVEMARAAGSAASKGDITGIRNIVWARPVRVDSAAQELSISLYPENSNISFEVSTHTEGDERVVHSQGILETGDYGDMRGKTLDLGAIRSRCDGEIDGPGCYKAFSSRGLSYGPSFHGIEALRYNEREVLARLIMPESVRDVSGQYVLHPSLMDSALQATLGLAVSSTGVDGTGDGVYLPFALNEVFIYGSIPETAYAYVRYSEGVDIKGRVLKYDITITDEEGRMVVEMKEFMVRALQGGEGALKPQSDHDVLYATSRWDDHTLQDVETKDDVDYLIVIAESEEELRELLSAECPDAEVVGLSASKKKTGRDVEGMFIEIFEKIRGRLEGKPKRVQRILVLVPDGDAGYCYAPLAGLLKTAHMENPRIEGKVVYCPVFTEESRAQFVTMVKQESASEVGGDREVRYEWPDKRQVRRLVEVKEVPQAVEGVPLVKSGGVYWITGGFGGLGRIFAEHLGQTEGVKLVLSGRSVLNEEKQKELDTLRQDGLDVSYIQSDISNLDDVAKAFKAIKEKHGKLDGVIHSAGVIRDALILKKRVEEVREVFSSKVTGALNLDAVIGGEKLDFMVLFSSVAGVLGNMGQSDYAGANAFLDAFALYRQGQVNAGRCSGKTVSIGWPLWRDGGMKVDEQVERMMKGVSGMVPLETSVGVEAFDRSMMIEHGHVVVAEGDRVKMREKLLLQKPTQPAKVQKALKAVTTTSQADTDVLLGKVKQELVRGVSEMLKVKKEEIDLESDMSDYGFDSITLTEFANKMNQEYKVELNPAVFFEHSTLGSFAEYLVSQNREQLALKYLPGASVAAKDAYVVDVEEVEEVTLPAMRTRFMAQGAKSVDISSGEAYRVAVIGMSGRMPGSSNLEEFWKNLEGGKDLISEIPADRWDWRAYYGDPQKEVNKTNIKWGGFIDDVDKFDPMFFGISPMEAELMDPQQRLFMECVWETIEDAGYKPSDLSGTKTGLYVGVASSDYASIIHEQEGREIEAHMSTGLAHSVLANRISYMLNLHG